ncbi:MAG: tetratricopeptide repeat protein [Thermoguttaceae bacterium]
MIPAVVILAVVVPATIAMAQADARQAYDQAKGLFADGNFEQARDLARQAAETDPKNPEAFLLLGKAHYQLGELDEAIAAWRRTLALAPEEPFATQMLTVLRARITEVDTWIRLVESLVEQQLYSPALQECTKLLADKALADVQRATVKTLQAESLLRMNKHAEALRVLREILVYHAQEADDVQISLLLGTANMRSGGDAVAEGIAILKKLVADHADTPAAAVAQYELAAFDLQREVTAARAEAMVQWLADHPDHKLADSGRSLLFRTYLSLATQAGKPTPSSDLSANDVKALALASEIYGQERSTDKPATIPPQLLDHLKTRYVDRGAHAPAIQALETLLAAPLSRDNRLTVLKSLASYKYLAAAKWLDETARAGQLPTGVARGQLPKKLAEVLATFETVRKAYPAEPLWIDQANLAKRVRASSAKVLPTAQFAGLKGPDAWALDVALPVIRANVDAAAVKSAVETVSAIIQERAKVNKAGSRKLAFELSAELHEAVSADDPSWAAAIVAHYKIVQDYAAYVFQENIKAGRADENAKLSDLQKAYLSTLIKHFQIEPAHAPFALVQLADHVKPWVERAHWAVAHEVYATVTPALPEQQRRQAELAVVDLWIRQVTAEHQRLSTVGLTVPRQLDPLLVNALTRCYELQAGLDDEAAILAQVRGVWETIVGHYKQLEYYETAEAAIEVKADAAVDAADEYAAVQLVRLNDEHARRELALRLSKYGASDQIALGPEFQAARDGWKQFITDRPSSPLVSRAVGAIFDIARLFEQHTAHLVAADVYADLMAFASEVEILSQSTPQTPSIAERAAFAQAEALDAHARKLLAKQMADKTDDTPAPQKLSDEFAAAIAAYDGLIATYGESPRIGRATLKIMAVALEYAKIDAWEVADSIFADLLASELAIHRPERIEFARGLCQLGPAMPGHARELLTTLASAGLRGSGEFDSGAMLAARLGTSDESFAVNLSINGTLGGLAGGGMGGGMGRGLVDGSATLAANAPGERTAAPQMPGTGPAPAAQPQSRSTPAPVTEEAQRDSQLLAMINRQESNRAAQVAQLRERFLYANVSDQSAMQRLTVQQGEQPAGQQQVSQQAIPVMPSLSEAELARQEKALSAAYDVFQGIRKDYPRTPTAEQARGEILVMVGHWRGLGEWQRSAALATQFLGDNPTDRQLPKLRLEVARDRLSWASKPLDRKITKQAMLAEVSRRYDEARSELALIVTDFPKEPTYQQEAQWDIAGSFLTQARVVGAFSSTLARGQYVRTAKELQQVAREYPTHPKIGTIPQMLWDISTELEGRTDYAEAILVWNDLAIYDPMHALAQQAATKIAQTYHQNLRRPLLAAQAYQELNFIRGGNDEGLQNAIFQIGSDLKNQKRWVEALHVLETFVDSFPRHAQAGQALTMVGQIHQTNEAWKDAIAAYRRVTEEFDNGQWIQEAKWSIAECTINLSQWREASDAYRAYVAAYPEDAQVAEANRRIDVLKDLARYQGLVDEEDQRKAFDAQYQIARIVAAELSNPVKAIIEYRKVVADWPTSHLADDALYAVGTTYLSLGETEMAREALLAMADKYETSPLADDALFMVGKSYEDEAGKLATVTRATTLERNKDVAQRRAYQLSQDNRFRQQEFKAEQIASLKKAGKGKSAEVAEASAASNF